MIHTWGPPRRDYRRVDSYAAERDTGPTQCSATRVGPLSSRRAYAADMRVLVVEDHTGLANRIAEGLRDQGMAVDIGHDGSEALEQTMSTGYDVVILDRDLPQVPGDTVAATLVASDSPTRVLMLTAAGLLAHLVSLLKLSSNDYLPKPFAF